MKQDKLRIVFMGTPDFAVASLEALLGSRHQVVGVVTMPDKAIGRHHDTLQASPVKECALRHGIPVLQPEKLRDGEFLSRLREMRADLQVVVAFRMLPEAVWAMPRLGTFNLHAALLPQYRGAAPINWAIINGDRQTGITTFWLDHQIDTGRIICQETLPIGPEDCAGDLHDRMMARGAGLVVRTANMIADGEAEAVPQEQFLTGETLRPAPKIFKETCQVRWSALDIHGAHNFVRGLSPHPAAWTTLQEAGGKRTVLKIYRTHPEPHAHNLPTGTLETDGRKWLRVATDGGYLYLEELQLAGKRRMPVDEFLRGAHVEGGRLVEVE
ncbi:MAG TPA: methionyl-tRNA formyltransferase [Prevotellaceae bacterium]|nr:methionyl-tRNA formyltransferase [Prevotellaceae bacterium]HBE54631.1 methionyl-tRNA formyltransferase [Prevotellaceae bacterium]